MYRVNRIRNMLFVVLAMAMAGCSSSGTGAATSDSVTLSALSDLPQATGPVVGSDSASLATKNAATTGMGLTADVSFSAGDSISACNMYNGAKEVLSEAAVGDLILCIIQTASNDLGGVDVYDGDFHAFALSMEGDEEAPDHVRFRVVKNADGNITNFRMYACNSGSQTFYIDQTIDGTDFSMNSISAHGENDGSQIAVEGTLNSSAQFIGTKTITVDYAYDGEQGGGFGQTVFEQTTDQITAEGYNSGSFGGGECEGTYQDRYTAVAELINGTSDDIGDFAVGDGAAQGNNVGSDSCNNEWDETGSEGWSGDTQAVDTSSEFLADVEALTLPTVGSAPTIAFSGSDESYDCGGQEEGTVNLAQSDVTSCSSLGFEHNWINCYDETQ